MYTGRCLCGGVRFRIAGALEPVQVCHCSQCRRAQGGPFATNIPAATAAFELTAGAELLTAYESSPGKQRVFAAAVAHRSTAASTACRVCCVFVRG